MNNNSDFVALYNTTRTAMVAASQYGANLLFPGHPAWFTGYYNVTCSRVACGVSKPTGTASLWCAACDALPLCDDCGDAVVDCDNQNRADDAKGDEDEYGCAGAWERHAKSDRESWVECQWADRMEDDYR